VDVHLTCYCTERWKSRHWDDGENAIAIQRDGQKKSLEVVGDHKQPHVGFGVTHEYSGGGLLCFSFIGVVKGQERNSSPAFLSQSKIAILFGLLKLTKLLMTDFGPPHVLGELTWTVT
jgi:hypothetical protein